MAGPGVVAPMGDQTNCPTSDPEGAMRILSCRRVDRLFTLAGLLEGSWEFALGGCYDPPDPSVTSPSTFKPPLTAMSFRS